MLFLSGSSPISRIEAIFTPEIELWVKRDDLIHPNISGNKFRKLKYPLLALDNPQAMQSTVISMGGAWSNHLHALAHAANLMQMNSIGLVRGIINTQKTSLTPTLQDCVELGMKLHFVSRENYRQLRQDEHTWRKHIGRVEAPYLWLPEGGCAPLAVKGVAELITELPFIPDTIVVACGTGTTLAGLVAGMQGKGRVVGIAAVQNAQYLHQQVSDLLQTAHYPAYTNFEILHDYHHGGFAKVNDGLLQFCEQFTQSTHIPVEPVYTGKLFYAIEQLTKSNFFKANERVLAIHTGGLQGARGTSQSQETYRITVEKKNQNQTIERIG